MRIVTALSVAGVLLVGVQQATAQIHDPYGELFPPTAAAPGPVSSLPQDHPLRTVVNLAPAADAAAPQGQEPHPAPKRTGVSALVHSIGSDFKSFPPRKSTWVILGVGAAAAALTHPLDQEVNEHFSNSSGAGFFAPGKYLGSFYVQLGTASGLYLFGRYAMKPADGESRTNKVSHLGFDMVRALVISQSLTQGMKYAVQRDRPTGECCAFPSGHASAAFATASVIERHLGARGAWPTFVVASYVAVSRIKDNRHYLSDVVFGAALGIVSGWTVVGRHGRSEYTMIPMPTRGGMMIAVIRNPDSHHGAD